MLCGWKWSQTQWCWGRTLMAWLLGFRAVWLGQFPALSTEKHWYCSKAGAEPGLGFLVGFGFSFMSFFPQRDEVGLLWPQAWLLVSGLVRLEESSCLTALPCCWVVSVKKGSLWRQVLPWKSACQLSEARPEALMRQKGIWAGIKIPGESEFLDCLVWLNYFLFDSEVLWIQSPT